MSGRPIKPIIIKRESLQKLVFTNNSFLSPSQNILFLNQLIKTEPDMISKNDADINKKFVIIKKDQQNIKKSVPFSPQNLNFITQPKNGDNVIYVQKCEPEPIQIESGHIIKNEMDIDVKKTEVEQSDDEDDDLEEENKPKTTSGKFKPQGNLFFMNQIEDGQKTIYIQRGSSVPIKKEVDAIKKTDTEHKKVIVIKGNSGKDVNTNRGNKRKVEVTTLRPQGTLNFATAHKDGKKVIYIQKVDGITNAGFKRKDLLIKDFKVTSSSVKAKKKIPMPKSPSPVPYVPRTPRPKMPKVVTLDDVRGRGGQMQNVYIPIKRSTPAPAAQSVHIPIKPNASQSKRKAPDCARVKQSASPAKSASYVTSEQELSAVASVSSSNNLVKDELIIEKDEPVEYMEEIMEEQAISDAGCEVVISSETEQQMSKMEYEGEGVYQEIVMDEESVAGYQCCDCGMQFETEEEMTAHTEAGHTFSYECTQCNHQTLDPEEARAHFREEHQMELVLADEEEDQLEDQIEEIQAEDNQWQSSEDYVASVVLLNQEQAEQDEGRETEEDAEQEEEVEEEEVEEEDESGTGARFGCRFCYKTFNTKSALESHMRKHEKDQVVALENLNRENPYCQDCDEQFDSKKGWVKHILNTRKHKEIRKMILNGCRYCGETSRSPNDYREHVKLEHPEKAVKRKWPVPQPCVICGDMFEDAYKYYGHFRKEHPTESYPRKKPCNYKCNECGSEFRCGALLKLHMNKHLGLRLFQCPECPKNFYTSLSLKYHQISHSEVRPFKCDTCDRGFKFKAAMERHQLVHTGERPFVCGVCNQGFTTMHWTQLHVRKVHNNEHIPYKPRVRRRRPRRAADVRVRGTMDE